jgi:hypothetical protein
VRFDSGVARRFMFCFVTLLSQEKFSSDGANQLSTALAARNGIGQASSV